ncbi:Cuticle protein 1 [Gryllus bimaculatus]|nr:Cuticle protein 1 [Gryllus bimaculatus]
MSPTAPDGFGANPLDRLNREGSLAKAGVAARGATRCAAQMNGSGGGAWAERPPRYVNSAAAAARVCSDAAECGIHPSLWAICIRAFASSADTIRIHPECLLPREDDIVKKTNSRDGEPHRRVAGTRGLPSPVVLRPPSSRCAPSRGGSFETRGRARTWLLEELCRAGCRGGVPAGGRARRGRSRPPRAWSGRGRGGARGGDASLGATYKSARGSSRSISWRLLRSPGTRDSRSSSRSAPLQEMALKLVLVLCLVAAALAAPQADRYPAGLNPALCPNYPHCDNSLIAAYGPAAAAAPRAREYPAGVPAAACPNYPFCNVNLHAPPLPGFSARLYPAGIMANSGYRPTAQRIF